MSSEHDDFVANLLDAPWRLFKQVTVEGARTSVQLDIRTPPPSILQPLVEKARTLRSKVDGDDTDALDWLAEVVATVVWRPGAVRSLFTKEQVKAWGHFSTVQADCLAAINLATAVETAKGKSEATPT